MQPPGYPNPGQDPTSGAPQQPDPYGQPGYGQMPQYNNPYGQPPAPEQPPTAPQYPEYQVQYPSDPTSGQPQQYPTSGQPYPTSGQPYQYAQPQPQQYPGYPAYPNTGYSVPPMGQPGQGQSNTLGLLSMIFGIASIPLAFCCGILGVALAIAAIVTGILGLKKVSQGQANNRGMALAGLICGGAGLVVFVVWIAISAGTGLLHFPTSTTY